jgi:transposase
MKSAIPWVLVLALLGGTYFLYSANQVKQAQLDKLTQDNQEVDKLRAENEELKKIPAQNDELANLRKDNGDLLRLRGEVQQLHTQVAQLNKSLASAQGQVAQSQQLQAAQISKLTNENAQLKNLAQQVEETQNTARSQQSVCINNLHRLQAAKQQWALEKGKTAADVPTPDDISPYLDLTKIVCPAGGIYSLNAVSAAPTCTVLGHVLGQQ